MRLLQGLMVVFVLSCGLQAAQSAFSGTWKLNPTKSTISAPSPRGEIIQVKADENSIEVTSDVVDPVSDKTTKSRYKATFDGQDYPVIGDPARGFHRVSTYRREYVESYSQEGRKGCRRSTPSLSLPRAEQRLSTTPKRTAKGTPTRGQRCMKSSEPSTTMAAAIYARKSTDQSGVSDEQRSVGIRKYVGRNHKAVALNA